MKWLFQKMTLPLLLSISANAYAMEIHESVQLHGFISQGYMYSPDNAFAGMAALILESLDSMLHGM
ncbi:MAG: hypothetical protein U9N57_14710 [Pseudomonadota bacterium]|nr:hypothetical protein [Pseudomonadota bacterium]